MNNDVFLSILSMDSYNRGGGGGLNVQGGLGIAVLAGDRTVPATGFFAQTYTWNGKTIISFRGTDFPNGMPALDDVFNGWVNGAGALGGQLGAQR